MIMRSLLFILLLFSSAVYGCSSEPEEMVVDITDDNDEGQDDLEEEQEPEPEPEPEDTDIKLSEWKMVWNEEFNEDVYNGKTQVENREILNQRWDIQNEPSTHILCGRYRENVEISDGTLKLINKKETRNGQNWTSGNIWTKRHFMYGYFECRYKYAAATGTNNSFWIMSRNNEAEPVEGYNFEIDINEGHFPCEVATNIHKWSGTHTNSSKKHIFGIQPGNSIPMEIPITARKVRFSSNYYTHFHIREFRVFNYIKGYSYPDPTVESYDKSLLTNYTKSATVTSSGVYQNNEASYSPQYVKDDKMSTSWVSQDEGEKWLEFDFGSEISIGCIQFVNGYYLNAQWNGVISDYKIQYEKDGKWIDIVSTDLSKSGNFAEEYHTYGLQWTKDELIYYFDRNEIRRIKNEFCYSSAPIWLSLAVITWSGPVTDAIDGTKMVVDYVRVYERK